MKPESLPHYPRNEPIAFGAPEEIADGIWWLRMPLDLTGLDHINLWLLSDGDGWTIVDTGMNSDRIRAHWDTVFETVFAAAPVRRVICTHFHPDHMGLAGWLTRRSGTTLWATRREWLFGRMLWLDAQETPPDWYMEHFRKLGFSSQALDGIRSHRFNSYRSSVTAIPEQVHAIRNDDEIVIDGAVWRVMVGHGHAPEHACLYCAEKGVLISGDQILPRITPHIGVYPSEPDGNPLQEYLDSLPSYAVLPADTLVLPAHGLPFQGLHARLDYLAHHHDERLLRLEEFCGEPTRVLSTLKVLFSRRLGPFEAFLGVNEALAHLHCLIGQGRMTREIDDDGVWVYRRQDTRRDAA